MAAHRRDQFVAIRRASTDCCTFIRSICRNSARCEGFPHNPGPICRYSAGIVGLLHIRGSNLSEFLALRRTTIRRATTDCCKFARPIVVGLVVVVGLAVVVVEVVGLVVVVVVGLVVGLEVVVLGVVGLVVGLVVVMVELVGLVVVVVVGLHGSGIGSGSGSGSGIGSAIGSGSGSGSGIGSGSGRGSAWDW